MIGITYDGLITRSCKVVHQDFEVEKYFLPSHVVPISKTFQAKYDCY